MFLRFILLGSLISGIGLSPAKAQDCNLSEKQMLDLRHVLCGDAENFRENCFIDDQKSRFRSYAVKSQTLRVCGYSDIADQADAAQLKFTEIVQPLGACLNQSADLRALLSSQIALTKTLDPEQSCPPARRAEAKRIADDQIKRIAAMKNPQLVRDRFYRMIGLKP